MKTNPLNTLRKHVTGKIESGQAIAIESMPIPERYFIYDYDEEGEFDLVEVSQERFDEEEGEISIERHSVWQNGVDQICYTKENV